MARNLLQGVLWPLVLIKSLLNRPYSYSRYWTGTSLQWRLMRVNLFTCKSHEALFKGEVHSRMAIFFFTPIKSLYKNMLFTKISASNER